MKNQFLLSGGKPRKQGQNKTRTAFGEAFTGFADILLRGQENQNILKAPLALQILHTGHGFIDIGRFALFLFGRIQRPPANLHRVHSARDFDNRRPVKRLCEFCGVDGGGRDDHLQVFSFLQQVSQIPQNEIDVQAAFVRFIDDDRIVGQQIPISGSFRKQDAVGHDPDQGLRRCFFFKADFIRHSLTAVLAELGCDARRDADGGNPSGLRQPDDTPQTQPRLQAHLGDLRRLARSGFAGNDNDLMIPDGIDNGLAFGADGQFRRKIQRGNGLSPLLYAAARGVHPALQPGGGIGSGGGASARRGIRGLQRLQQAMVIGDHDVARLALHQANQPFMGMV
ncbi:MAG: hypothetical protein BWX45_00493 [Deltaproteobacteria bacterium ADurb.Bin002]|nr:MAG: hypothetical protein BWX45_00493 [Deltaproteobacteria bacterium ADurb.Bin002]